MWVLFEVAVTAALIGLMFRARTALIREQRTMQRLREEAQKWEEETADRAAQVEAAQSQEQQVPIFAGNSGLPSAVLAPHCERHGKKLHAYGYGHVFCIHFAFAAAGRFLKDKDMRRAAGECEETRTAADPAKVAEAIGAASPLCCWLERGGAFDEVVQDVLLRSVPSVGAH